MKSKLFLIVLLAAPLANAAGGGHGHSGGIPSVVWHQLINFGLYSLILFFVLRKPLTSFFHARAEAFRHALRKAETARSEAEKQKREIEQRLAQLQSTAEESIARAKSEAEELKRKILDEAQELSRMLREDARRTADIELQRAKAQLREEVLTQSVASAKAILSEKIAEPDQRRLQSEFVEKIQVVR